MNNELYTSITNGDIQKSILLATKIIFLYEEPEKLEYVYVDICSYIGTFVYLKDISKVIDIYQNTILLIETEKINIKDVYILLTKMCIICDIYNKHPTAKCNSMSLLVLKSKISNIINSNEMKLSQNGVIKFEGILPPPDNENYSIALKIISIIIKNIKSTDDISVDDLDKLTNISNDLRLVIEYILRKKFKFETKFNNSDDDVVWFLWGVYSLLYKEDYVDNAYSLFNYEYKKKYRNTRTGLLHSMALICIYIHKKDASPGWSSKERDVINKISEVSIDLYKEIKRDIIKENPDRFEKPKKKNESEHDGLEYIYKYIPEINNENKEMTNTAYTLYPKSTSAKTIEGVNANDNSRIILY